MAKKSDVSTAAALLGRKGGQVKCRKGFAVTDPATAREMGRRGANARWQGIATTERCPCGVMTLKRAKARGKSQEHKPGCEFWKGGK